MPFILSSDIGIASEISPSLLIKTFLARLCQQAKCYDEMAKYIKPGGDISMEERRLLFVAYQNVLTTRRASWRRISSVEKEIEPRGSKMHIQIIQEYRQKIEVEIENTCQDILDVLNESLIPKAESRESKAHYNKLYGDYYRYIAKFALGEKYKVAAAAAHEAYKTAIDVAETELISIDPIRLALALNFSVFYYNSIATALLLCSFSEITLPSGRHYCRKLILRVGNKQILLN
ncbi:14-3-3 protein-domain-containing protein [Macrophomina phaseolina]|uniref:14-3-3 protein-domain-containing protein n=1 Tax=Macrophomina phaseolina TaxID=35725 RepID=A0ABQ8FQF8_9PEZI|nr:14-3-3 protein-domain-containing protein [Macrophomina phaseolina]